jgi:hypothetical protein
MKVNPEMTTIWTQKRKIFLFWVAAVYFSYVAFIILISFFKSAQVPFHLFFSLRGQSLLLIPCIFPAALGTVLLHIMSIRRAWLGVIIGIVLAAGGLAFSIWLEIQLLGSFEANAGIYLEALIMLLPNCVAGAWAGFAYFKVSNTGC